jgi:hypothetical protein
VNLDRVHALDANFLPLVGDRVLAIAREPVDAVPDKEVGPELLGRAEQLGDIALAIADGDAACGRAEQGHGLAQVVRPADALLVLDRNPRRSDCGRRLWSWPGFGCATNLTARWLAGSPQGSAGRAW